MRPCREYRERIALAVVDGDLGEDLKRHTQNCPACAAYAEELKRLCEEHQNRARSLPEPDAPPCLHARLAEAIRGRDVCCGVEVRASLRRLLQGLGLAATAVIIGVVAVNLAGRRPPSPLVVTEVTTPEMRPEPTFAAYHNRLARSVEEFEASLRDHGAVGGGDVLKVSSAAENLP